MAGESVTHEEMRRIEQTGNTTRAILGALKDLNQSIQALTKRLGHLPAATYHLTVTAYTSTDLDDEVFRLLQEGWQPIGGVSVIPVDIPVEQGCVTSMIYVRAMIK